MKPLFAQQDIFHLGYLVDDMEAAARMWTDTYGAGPFMYWKDTHSSEYETVLFGGQQVHYTKSFLYGAVGQLTVELMRFELESPPPPAFRDFLAGRGTRFHHVAHLHEDPDAEAARLEALGFPIIGEMTNSEGNSYYLDARQQFGGYIELIIDLPGVRGLKTEALRLAEEWDGDDLLRDPPG